MCVVILRPLGTEDREVWIGRLKKNETVDRQDESQGWTGAKTMMSDVGFLRALQEYKKDRLIVCD